MIERFAYISIVLHMLRDHRGFFIGIALAGLALRLFFLIYFPVVTDDSRVYMDLATNWLQHGVYGQTDSGQVVPGDTRLPGYPAFLAAIFGVFGTGKIRAVLVMQILADLTTCLLIADLARRISSRRWAGRVGFLLAALCPFLASYAAAVLSETVEIFFTALALDCAVAARGRMNAGAEVVCGEAASARRRSGAGLWAATGAAIGACILVRPDGGILLAATGLYLVILIWRCRADRDRVRFILLAGVTVSVFALGPLVPWTIRNFKTLHRFQPLAPRYATDADEVDPRGFNRWVSTWMEDYTSVEEIYWNVPGDKIDATKLPARALDTAKDETLALIAEYNETQQLTPELDARFREIAAENIQAHPLRCYIELPLLRVADMWLRPRTELLPADPRWWQFNDEPWGSAAAVSYGLLNLLYAGAAALALIRGRGELRYAGLLAGFLLLRSAFLGTVENPEPRYMLECYPVVIALAAAAVCGLFAGGKAAGARGMKLR